MIKRGDPNWHGTKEWLEEQIGQAQLQLERIDLAEAEHNRTRGMIAAYREIIKTVEPKPTPAMRSPNYSM